MGNILLKRRQGPEAKFPEKNVCVMKLRDSSNRQLRSEIIDDEPELCMLVAHILRQKNIHPDYATTLAGGKRLVGMRCQPGSFGRRIPKGIHAATPLSPQK